MIGNSISNSRRLLVIAIYKRLTSSSTVSKSNVFGGLACAAESSFSIYSSFMK